MTNSEHGKSNNSEQDGRKRKRVRREQGDELDIHSVYQGQLDRAWQTREHIVIDRAHHLYTVFIDVGGLADVNFQDSLWRGAVAIQIVDDLIKAGKSVKVVVGASANGVLRREYRKVVSTDIVVKNYNEPLSMERLAAMSNIGFHRVFNFMSRCYHDLPINSNMGSTTSDMRHRGPVEDTGLNQDVSKHVYVGKSTSMHSAENDLKRIYSEILQ